MVPRLILEKASYELLQRVFCFVFVFFLGGVTFMTLGMTLGVYQCLLCLQYLIQTMMTTLIMNLFSNTASFIFFPLNEKSYIAGVRVFLRVTLMTLFFFFSLHFPSTMSKNKVVYCFWIKHKTNTVYFVLCANFAC